MADHGGVGFVRDATAADASDVASIQLACWRHDYSWPEEMFDAVVATDPEMQWARAVIAPPGPGYRLVVATEGSQVVGYAAMAPAQASDAEPGELEIVAWEVHPEHRGRGHGSRLIAAVADHARLVGAHSLSMWIEPIDQARRYVLTDAGFGPDGAHRTVQATVQAPVQAPVLSDDDASEGLTLRHVRLVTNLAAESTA